MTGRVVVPIWTPRDAVDTAQAFAMELHNAEQGRHVVCSRCNLSHFVVRINPDGICRRCRRETGVVGRRLFSVSRERRARRMDALALALLMLVMAALGCLVLLAFTPQAKADDSDALAYAAHYGAVICDVLDERPGSIPGLMGVLQGVQEHSGMTAFDSGQAVGLAVADICPRHMPLLRRFVAAMRVPV